MANLLDFLGRVFISTLFLFSAYNKILNYSGTVGWMESFGVPGFLLGPTIGLEIVLPLFIIIGYQTKLSSILLALFSIITAVIFHSDFSDQMQLIAFLKNIGLAGGFIFLAAHGAKEWAVDNKKKYVRL
jgi:putative oxidoreductase